MVNKIPRSIYNFSDQIFFSLGNFGLTIILSRLYGDEIFAGFGIGLSIALMLQSIQRGIYVVPCALQSTKRARKVMPGIIGEHNIALLTVAVIFLLIFSLVESFRFFLNGMELVESIVISSFVCALIYMQADFDRFIYSRGTFYYVPFLFSVAYVIAILTLYYLSSHFKISHYLFLSAIASIFLLKAFFSSIYVSSPNYKWGLRMLKRDLVFRGAFSVEGAIAYAGYNHMPLFILGFSAAPIEAAAFVAMRGLVQPIQIIIRALDVGDKLRIMDLNKSGKSISSIFFKTIIKYSLVCGVMIIGTAIISPYLASIAYHDAYSGYEWLMVGHASVFLLLSLTLPVESIINIKGTYRQMRFWRFASAAIGIVFSAYFCKTIGATGAMLATLIGWTVAFLGGVFVVRGYIFKLK